MIHNLSTPKKIALLLALTVLVSIGVFLVKKEYFQNLLRDEQTNTQADQETINYEEATEEEKNEVENNKASEDFNEQEGQQISKNIRVVTRVEEGSLIVQGELYGVGWRECRLSLAAGSQIINKAAPTIFQPTYYSCEGFAIPLADLSSSKVWDVTLGATNSDGSIYSSGTKEVSIE